MLIKVGSDLFRILDLHHLTPGNKRAHIQVRMRNIRTLALADHKFRAEEDVERAILDEREMQYLYNDGDTFYFMDTSTFDQVHISEEALGDSKYYLIPDSVIRVEFYESEPVGIELPQTVDLLVKETAPGIKGATASNQIKPATLETGLVVNVPPFINEGDRVRVNTVHPGSVDTPMIQNQATYHLFLPDHDAGEITRNEVAPAFQAASALPVPWMEPVDISNAVLFLASDEARYITGVTLPVDAGVLVK